MRLKSRFSTFVASVLAASILGTAAVPAQAETAAAPSPASSASSISPAETPAPTLGQASASGGHQAVPYGVKRFLVKKALKGVAGTIRGGGSKFVDLAGEWLDKKAADTIRKDSVRIADAVDEVANIPDVATHQVRNEASKRLSEIMDSGTANVIANAVEGVLWILL